MKYNEIPLELSEKIADLKRLLTYQEDQGQNSGIDSRTNWSPVFASSRQK